jgi:radical SAM protein with 4Fe4S-binding SPASM domain
MNWSVRDIIRNRRETLMKRFKKVYIEITNVCNLKCTFCPVTKRPPTFMDAVSFTRILDQIAPYTDYCYLHVKGEPLLHPDLDKFLDIACAKGIKVNITTNGTLIGQMKDKLISKSALRQINFSLHSFDANSGSVSKEEYMADILSFAKEARVHSNILISLRFWNLDGNDMENAKNRELYRIIEREFNLQSGILEKPSDGRGMEIADGIYVNRDHLFTWPDLDEKEDDGEGSCYGLRDQIAILADGTVVPCCLDGEGVIDLGNIYMTGFKAILESDRARNIAEGFKNKKAVEELCRKCGYRKRFD